MKVNDLLEILSDKYHYDSAMEWDNIGLIFGSRNDGVNKVLTSLNIDLDTCKKAVECGCNVIVSHHPLLSFKPLQSRENSASFEAKHSIIRDYYEGQLIEFIIKNNLNVIALHTNADFTCAYVATWIANYLGYDVVEQIEDDTAVVVKINQKLRDVLVNVKEKTGKTIYYVGDLDKQIATAIIIGGGGGYQTSLFLRSKHDLLLTGDLTYHNFHDTFVQGSGDCIVDIGHYLEVVFVNNVLKGIDVDWIPFEIENFIKEF